MTTSELQQFALAIVVIFPALAVITVCLRIYSRFASSLFGWDDVFVILAMIMSFGETYLSWMYIKTNFVGIHLADIPPDHNFVVGLQYNYAVQVMYNPILSLVKTSVLLFLLRVSGQRNPVRIAIWSLIVLNNTLMIAIFGAITFQCTPISFNWNSTITGHCVKQPILYITTAATTIFTDILVLLLPFWIVIGLKMARRMKIAIISVFFLGFLVTIAGVARLAILIQGEFGPPSADPTFDIGFTTSAIETNLAIITASAPAMKPLFKRWFPSLFAVNASQYRDGVYDGILREGQHKRPRPAMTSMRTGIRSMHDEFLLESKLARIEKKSKKSTDSSQEEIGSFHGILETRDVSVVYQEGRGDGISHLSDKSALEYGMRTSVESL